MPETSQPPLTPPASPGRCNTTQDQADDAPRADERDADNASTEPGPETPYLPCRLQDPTGLMELISSGQASVQALTGEQVCQLHLSPADKEHVLRLSNTLTGFSRIFYHAPGQPRVESTLILTHPEVNKKVARLDLRWTSLVASKDVAPYAELDDMTNMIKTFRRTIKDAERASAGKWVYPPTTCGTLNVNSRRAKIIVGLVWLKPGEYGYDNRRTPPPR